MKFSSAFFPTLFYSFLAIKSAHSAILSTRHPFLADWIELKWYQSGSGHSFSTGGWHGFGMFKKKK
jgi:hypothetical protein